VCVCVCVAQACNRECLIHLLCSILKYKQLSGKKRMY